MKMYVTICPRPDITYVVSVLSRFMSYAGEFHQEAMKNLIKYLKGTRHLGLMFKIDKISFKWKLYVDFDFTKNSDNRKSTTAHFYMINNTCISRKSHLKKLVALCSTKIEYIAAIEAVKEGLWVKELFNELELIENQVKLCSTYQSAIS